MLKSNRRLIQSIRKRAEFLYGGIGADAERCGALLKEDGDHLLQEDEGYICLGLLNLLAEDGSELLLEDGQYIFI